MTICGQGKKDKERRKNDRGPSDKRCVYCWIYCALFIGSAACSYDCGYYFAEKEEQVKGNEE